MSLWKSGSIFFFERLRCHMKIIEPIIFGFSPNHFRARLKLHSFLATAMAAEAAEMKWHQIKREFQLAICQSAELQKHALGGILCKKNSQKVTPLFV
jgi:hypothetical protein